MSLKKLIILSATILCINSCSTLQNSNAKITDTKFKIECSKDRDIAESSKDTLWKNSTDAFYFDFENKSIDFNHVIKFDLVSDNDQQDADGVVRGRILGMKEDGATFPGYGIGLIDLGEGNASVIFTDISGGKTEYFGKISSTLDDASEVVSLSNKDNGENSLSDDMDKDARQMAHLSLLVEQEGQLAATTGTKEMKRKFKEDNNKVKVLLDKWKDKKVEFYQLCEKHRNEIQNQ